MDDGVDSDRDSKNQICSQANDDGGVGVRDASINDLQVRGELEPGRDRAIVKQLDARSVVRIEEGAEFRTCATVVPANPKSVSLSASQGTVAAHAAADNPLDRVGIAV